MADAALRQSCLKQLAQALTIRINTVRDYVRHIYQKLGVGRGEQALVAEQRPGEVAGGAKCVLPP